MKIAHVVDSMEVGGAEIMVSTLCRLHRAAGHDVSVHCLYRLGSLAAALQKDGTPVILHGPSSSLRLTRTLYRFFRQFRPDVVHCHNAAATIIAAPASRFASSRTAVISTRHGLVAPPQPRFQEAKFWTVANLFCDRVVAVCDATHRNLLAAPGARSSKVVMIRNGAEPAAPPVTTNAAINGHFNVITVARMTAAKDPHTLLEAIQIAASQFPTLKFWVVGDGPLLPELRTRAAALGIADHVRFLGERHDIGCWLGRAHLFVLSSVTEGLPIALLEAMAAGLPCIVTDVGGMPEVVRGSGGGCVVPARSPQSIAAAILHYAKHPSDAVLAGTHARQYYTQCCTPIRMADAYQGLYQHVMRAG